MNFLRDDERVQLKLQHKQERDGRIRDRIKAVLLSDKGWTTVEIAEALLLSEDAIGDHITEYKKSQKLKPENGGSVEKLSVEQSEQLENHLYPFHFKVPEDFAFNALILGPPKQNVSEATYIRFRRPQKALEQGL